MTGTKVEAIHHHGVPATDGFVVGRVLSAEQHPDADRLKVCSVQLDGDGEPPVTHRLRRAQRGRRADGRRGAAGRGHARRLEAAQGQAPRRQLRRHDPVRERARDRLGRGGHPRARRAGDRGRARAGDAVGAGAADLLRGARARDHPQPARLPGRVRRGPRAARRDRGAARAGAVGRRTRAAAARCAAPRCEVLCPDLCPRFTARVFENVTVAPSPPWLKARLTAAGQRTINNVVDITNYAMLLTGQPLHAFDLDRVEGARLTVRRAAEGEQVRDARRPDPHPRRRDGRDRGRARADLDRRPDGRGALGGRAGDEQGAARGRHLERAQHPPQLVGAGAAQRGLGALREGARAGAVHARPGGRHAADDRAVRRDRRPGHDRRRRRPRRPRADPPAQRRVRAILGVEVAPRAPGRDPARRSTSTPSRPRTACWSACRRCAATTSPARST